MKVEIFSTFSYANCLIENNCSKETTDIIPTDSSLLLYQTDDGQTKIEVRLQDETVWLTLAQLCEWFDKDKRTISEHIQNIFKEVE